MTTNSSNSSGGGGNTITPPSSSKKQISPCIRWCFTLNNYTNEDISSIVPIIEHDCKYAIVAREVGEQGTPHLQGYVEFKTKCRPLSKFNNVRIHWEKCKGNRAQNTDYCSKDNDIIFTLGMPKPVKVIDTLRPWQHEIEKIMLTEPDDRTIHWYWDRDGNIGKTAFMKYCVVKHNAIPCVGGKFADIMNLVFNCDLDKSNTTIFNIPRGHRECLSYSSLEAIKDGMIVNTKYETGFKVFNPPHVIVFANFPPDEKQLSKDRWHIVNLKEHIRQGDV
ncbi:MAG: putative viral replication protein [Cressdnaviricota sp.]|nr:MAG: putative viral replication protein [Cressdnaviricota sp.]